MQGGAARIRGCSAPGRRGGRLGLLLAASNLLGYYLLLASYSLRTWPSSWRTKRPEKLQPTTCRDARELGSSACRNPPVWKARWLRPRPAGTPEAPLSARSRRRLPRASARLLGRWAAWVALAGTQARSVLTRTPRCLRTVRECHAYRPPEGSGQLASGPRRNHPGRPDRAVLSAGRPALTQLLAEVELERAQLTRAQQQPQQLEVVDLGQGQG